MTANIPPSLDTQNAADLSQIRQQLTTLQNVLVSLHGVNGNSHEAYKVERSFNGLGDSVYEANHPVVPRSARGSKKIKNTSFINGLLKLSQRQVVAQFSTAIKRAIVRDL